MYQKKTIRKAPEHVRPLMRVANDMEIQLRRFHKSIIEQITKAEDYREIEATNGILEYQLKASKEPSPLTHDEFFNKVDYTVEVDEFGNPIFADGDLEDMSNFNQRPPSGNHKGCYCVGWGLSDEDAKESVLHVEGCTRKERV